MIPPATVLKRFSVFLGHTIVHKEIEVRYGVMVAFVCPPCL
jgi:hypothetical protein